MTNPIVFTLPQLWGWILAFCAAIITIAGAVAVVIKVINAAKKPNNDQNARLTALEERVGRHDQILAKDNIRIETIEAGTRVTQQALLALLDHGLDGNNVEQMKKAKDALQKHLIER